MYKSKRLVSSLKISALSIPSRYLHFLCKKVPLILSMARKLRLRIWTKLAHDNNTFHVLHLGLKNTWTLSRGAPSMIPESCPIQNFLSWSSLVILIYGETRYYLVVVGERNKWFYLLKQKWKAHDHVLPSSFVIY